MRLLLTGANGFVGHHVLEHFLKNTDAELVVLDKLTYASFGFDRIRDIDCFNESRVLLLACDFSNALPRGVKKEIGDVNYIIHMGAETHVDRSIEDPEPFVKTNVLGTMHMLNYARECKNLRSMCYFSTDEVFGPAPQGHDFTEWERYKSSNPYAATKAGGEELALAYHNTYHVPVFITHTQNVLGERQHPEKFLGICIRSILKGDVIPIHADVTKTKSGSRFYIHAREVANALHFLLDRAIPGEKYNIVGEREISNLELAELIAMTIGKEAKIEFVSFHASRPGHDLRYAMSGKKLADMGWKATIPFNQALDKTVKWMLARPEWLNPQY